MSKKSTTYFSHDSNARSDEKLLAVRMRHRAEGYGVFFMIVEMMADEPSHTLLKDYNMIAFELRVGADVVKSVVEDFGLFQFTEDGERFYSESLIERMTGVDNLRQKRISAAQKRWAKTMQTDALASKNECNAYAMHDFSDAKNSTENKKSETSTKKSKKSEQECKNDENECTCNALASKNECNAYAMHDFSDAKKSKVNYILEKNSKEKKKSQQQETEKGLPAYVSTNSTDIKQLYEELRTEFTTETQNALNAERVLKVPRTTIVSLLDDFLAKLTVEGNTTASRRDFRHHFLNWAAIQVKKAQSNLNTTKPDATNRLHVSRGTTGDYHTDF